MLKGHTDVVGSVAFSPDGLLLATAGGELKVKVWSVITGRETVALDEYTTLATSLAFSPDGKRLAAGYFSWVVKLWDVDTGHETHTLKGHTNVVNSVAFSPDGQRLASASYDKTVKVWDAFTGQVSLTLTGHTGKVLSVAFSPDGQRLASASFDQTVKVWNVPWDAKLSESPLVVTNSIGMKLRLIKAGAFQMGATKSTDQLATLFETKAENFENEFPRHRVTISQDFRLGVTEVTQSQWQSVMNTQPWSGKTFVKEGADYPATYVSWDDAVEFCRKLSAKEGVTYRLPTEAEWEYACRAGSTSMYSFGDSPGSLKDYAWIDENAYDVDEKFAHRVEQKRPNALGLYDMHGNVFEWCSDWFGSDCYKSSPAADPRGPSWGPYRVFRGGSWNYSSQRARSAFRDGNSPGLRSYGLGFRVLRSSIGSSVPTVATPVDPPVPPPVVAAVRSGTLAGEEQSDNSLKMKLVWCPPGKFTMGSPASELGRKSTEDQVAVTLTQGFWLGKYEVTQREWRDVMDSELWKGKRYTKEGDQIAATCVSWDDAVAFCGKLTASERVSGQLSADWEYALPTEAQWEYACRSGTLTAYGFGDSASALKEYGWFSENASFVGEQYAHEVGLKLPNGWNLHDMHGNVYEWCRDSYSGKRRGVLDPRGPSSGSDRVFRGGSWLVNARNCRSAYRDRDSPDFRLSDLGFRVLRSSIK